ncbi:hypothetical protein [Endozoicomonas sp. ALC066]|uniref:hypothetical protein n=1 Tax=Endozoicomonas sp. ALC066 TaxID=3403078 RepID=UPI003BB539E6
MGNVLNLVTANTSLQTLGEVSSFATQLVKTVEMRLGGSPSVDEMFEILSCKQKVESLLIQEAGVFDNSLFMRVSKLNDDRYLAMMSDAIFILKTSKDNAVEIKPLKSAKFVFDIPNFKWSGNEIMQTCRVAGHEMMLVQTSDDQPEIYELHFMNYMASNFVGLEEAKNSAQEFALNVVQKLMTEIKLSE